METIVRGVIIAAFLASTAGCASSIKKVTINFTSNPPGAEVYEGTTISLFKRIREPNLTPFKLYTSVQGDSVASRYYTAALSGYEYSTVKYTEGVDTNRSVHFDLKKIPESKLDYGDHPTNYQELIMSYYQTRLFDPLSALYRFSYEPKSVLSELCVENPQAHKANQGCYIVTFHLNAKNRYGGYTGEKQASVWIRNGRIVRATEPF